jgi:hypothetical protein
MARSAACGSTLERIANEVQINRIMAIPTPAPWIPPNL